MAVKVEAPKPGIYYDILGEDFAQWDAVSQRRLLDIRRSPSHCRFFLDHPEYRPKTPAMEFGVLLHEAVLEPEKFDSTRVCEPGGDRRKKEYKAEVLYLQRAGKSPVNRTDWNKIMMMRDKVRNNPDAMALLIKSETEVSAICEDPETGLKLKARPDIVLADSGILGDLKTVQSGALRDMERNMAMSGWHIQAAHYLHTMNYAEMQSAQKGIYQHFLVVAVESNAPFETAVYALDQAALEVGDLQFRKYLNKYAECLKTDNWPGYTVGIEGLSLPGWFMSDSWLERDT